MVRRPQLILDILFGAAPQSHQLRPALRNLVPNINAGCTAPELRGALGTLEGVASAPDELRVRVAHCAQAGITSKRPFTVLLRLTSCTVTYHLDTCKESVPHALPMEADAPQPATPSAPSSTTPAGCAKSPPSPLPQTASFSTTIQSAFTPFLFNSRFCSRRYGISQCFGHSSQREPLWRT